MTVYMFPGQGSQKVGMGKELFEKFPDYTQKANEILGSVLLSIHNISYYQELMKGIREAIKNNELKTFVENFHERRKIGDLLEL